MIYLMVLIICASFVKVKSSRCNLNRDLIKEIQSYKAKADQIVSVVRSYGDLVYKEYSKFIETFGHRMSGSKNLELSIDYMINLTKSYGSNDITTEMVDVPHWVRGIETLEMITPLNKKMQILGLGSSISTPENGITAEAIVVKSFKELANMPEDKVMGKIVVFNQKYEGYSETSSYRNIGAHKAALKGAIAALVRSITPFSLYTLHTGQNYYLENGPQIPVASITVEDAKLLSRLQSQHKLIILKLKMSSESNMTTSRNVLIDLKGDKLPKQQVIVSGHIDSWDVGDGAMDDGGGMFISWLVPVVLNKLHSTAKNIFTKPRRTIRAILWTGKEPGLLGAFSYFEKRKDHLSEINFIMESDKGTFEPLGLEVVGNEEACCIIGEILKLFKTNKMVVQEDTGSDIYPFLRGGVPGAGLLTKNEKYYWYHHSEADTLDVQNKKDLVECAAFWTVVSYIIADISVDIPKHK